MFGIFERVFVLRNEKIFAVFEIKKQMRPFNPIQNSAHATISFDDLILIPSLSQLPCHFCPWNSINSAICGRIYRVIFAVHVANDREL